MNRAFTKLPRRLFTSAVGLSILTFNIVSGAPNDQRVNYEEIPQVKKINERIRTVWQEFDLQPSGHATDGEWCRRLFLDVLGRIPRVKELDEFVKSTDANKKLKLVNTLLYDEKYTEEYARNWTTLWTNVLIGRTGGNDDDALTNREGMQKFLRDSFAKNKPYNVLVRELVTATGTPAPGTPKFNGAVNFLIDKVNDEKGALATAATTKVFLGLQVQCTQCHNHPFNEWKQQKYWEMNAFFRQSRALRAPVVELINQDFGGESGDPEEAEIFYELRNGELKVAYPVFVNGEALGQSGYLEDVDRRTELGKLMMQSEYMDKMIVNRMWGHFLGHGFTKPLDDLGPHNPPSHPLLLEYLGKEIRKNSYNLKDLVKWVVLSAPYQLSSKMTTANSADDPLLGETPKFSHFYLRQMRAEELYESLLIATEAEKAGGAYEEQERIKNQWLQQFVTAFGTDEGDETTSFNGTIPQVLMMFNGDLMKKATSTSKGSMLWKVANSKMKPAQQIDHLFRAALARRPTSNELKVAEALALYRFRETTDGKRAPTLQDKQKATAEALKDVWWVVLNSNEFIFNH